MAANSHVTGTGKAGAFGSASGNSVRLRPETSIQIAMVEPAQTPVLTMFNMLPSPRRIINPEYTVQEEWPIGHVAQGNAVEAAADTAIALDDTSFLIPACVIMNNRTSEHMYVTAVAATNVTVTRAFGTTVAAATLTTDRYIMVATAPEEGQDAIQNRMRATGSHINYAQKFPHKSGITDIMSNHGVFGPPEEVRLNTQAVLEQKKMENRAYILGEPKKDTSIGTHTIYTTGGIRYWASLYNNVNMGEGFSWKTLARAMQAIIRFGGNGNKFGLTSQRLWLEISSLKEIRDLARTTPQATEVGFEIMRVKFPGGTLNLVIDHNMEEEPLDEEILVYDMQYINLVIAEPFTAEKDIQTPGAYRKEWQLFRRTGLEQRLPVSSGRLFNAKYAV